MIHIDLDVPEGADVPRGAVEAAIRRALELGGPDGQASRRAHVSVTFLADDPIRELNRRWLDHDWVPDVLSFTLGEAPMVADVYVGLEQARRQAGDHGVPMGEELVRLVVHGVLHTLGFDHPDDETGRHASPQYERQEAIVREVVS